MRGIAAARRIGYADGGICARAMVALSATANKTAAAR
jgi:hypothetical protein